MRNLSIVLLFLLGGAAVVAALVLLQGDGDSGDPVRGTPEETFSMFVSAAKRGDVETYCRLQGASGAALLRYHRAQRALDTAVGSRFGAPPRYPVSLADDIRQGYTASYDIKRAENLGKNRILLTVRISRKGGTGEEPWLAFVEDGEWRIMPPGNGKVRVEMRRDPDGVSTKVGVLDYDTNRFASDRSFLAELAERRAIVLERLADDVIAGRFGSMDDVEKRHEQLMRDVDLQVEPR